MSAAPLEDRIASIVEIMKTVGEQSEADVLAPFKTKARWAARRFGPFFNMTNALYAGLPSDDTEVMDEDRAAFDHVMALHPEFPQVVAGFQGEPDAYEAFVQMMSVLMNDARSDDTHLTKYGIGGWLPLDPVGHPLHPALVGPRKDNRGWYHHETARALTPLSRLDEFNADPGQFCNKVQNGTIKIGVNEYPSFLYPAGTVYNPDNEEEGLFRGHAFIRTLRAIYTGKGSALDGYRTAPRDSQAEINKMREAFAEAVATTAVQAHFALSSLGTWNEIDKSDFDYFIFFKNCVRLFTEDLEDEWVVETLKFLTNQMPALKRRRKHPREDDNEDGQGEDQTSTILARRAARRAAREQEAREQEENQAREREANQAREREQEPTGNPAEPEDRRLTPPPSSSPGRFFRDLSPSPPSTSHPRQPLPRSSPAPRVTPELVPPRELPRQNPAPAQRTVDPRPPATSTSTFRVISAAPNNVGASGSAQSQSSISVPLQPTSCASTSGVPVPPQSGSTSAKNVPKATKKKKKPSRRGW